MAIQVTNDHVQNFHRHGRSPKLLPNVISCPSDARKRRASAAATPRPFSVLSGKVSRLLPGPAHNTYCNNAAQGSHEAVSMEQVNEISEPSTPDPPGAESTARHEPAADTASQRQVTAPLRSEEGLLGTGRSRHALQTRVMTTAGSLRGQAAPDRLPGATGTSCPLPRPPLGTGTALQVSSGRASSITALAGPSCR